MTQVIAPNSLGVCTVQARQSFGLFCFTTRSLKSTPSKPQYSWVPSEKLRIMVGSYLRFFPISRPGIRIRHYMRRRPMERTTAYPDLRRTGEVFCWITKISDECYTSGISSYMQLSKAVSVPQSICIYGTLLLH